MKKIIYSILLAFFIAVTGFSQTTYNQVANIFFENCASCHRPGGGAPFSMLTYSETAQWSHAIEHALQDKDMPPWGADTSYLRFVNERRITAQDKAAILNWIADGAIEGDPAFAPTPPSFPEFLLNGTPDLTLQMPSFNSNADATDSYNTVVVPTGLTQDRIIRAIEVVPTDPELAHHVIINADDGGQVTTDLSGITFEVQGSITIGGYQPGANPIVFPNSPELKMGIEIPAGADFVLQIHTPKGTLGQPVDLQIRVYFFPIGETDIRTVHTFVPLQYWGADFFFQPEEVRTISTESTPGIPADISIYSALPHSHQICTEIVNYAYNNGDTIKLMKIDRWDFEHQVYYYYKNLVKIPTGYTYHADHKYDNSSSNHHNPFDPPQTITVGPNSDNEMLFDSFQFLVYETGDELINVDSILNNDPLLNYVDSTSSTSVFGTYRMKPSYVSPNPIKQKANIYFYHPHEDWNEYSLNVTTIEGKKVDISYRVNEGYIEIERKDVKPGVYFYQILDDINPLSTGNIVIQ